MRYHPVDIRIFQSGFIQCFHTHFVEPGYSQLENCLAIHINKSLAFNGTIIQMAGKTQNIAIMAVCMQGSGQNTGFIRCRQYDSTRPIAEQHAGSSVVIINNAGIGFRADHKHFPVDTGPDETVGH